MWHIHLLLASSLLGSSTTATAQHPLVLERLTAWNAAARQPAPAIIQEQVMKSAAAAQKRSGGCLPTTAVIDSIAPATSARFIFQGIAAGRMKNGWTVTARHPNCDSTSVRYTIAEDSAGVLSTIRTNRGVSLANESLVGDTLPLAAVQGVATLKRAGINCSVEQAVLGVTRVTKQEPTLGPDVFGVRYIGVWSEVWPIALCGRTVEVAVRFTADGDGGAYTDLKGTEAKLLPRS